MSDGDSLSPYSSITINTIITPCLEPKWVIILNGNRMETKQDIGTNDLGQ